MNNRMLGDIGEAFGEQGECALDQKPQSIVGHRDLVS